MPRLKRSLATLVLGCAISVGATARAELPDKNQGREGWIKASMTGKQAAFCPAGAPSVR